MKYQRVPVRRSAVVTWVLAVVISICFGALAATNYDLEADQAADDQVRLLGAEVANRPPTPEEVDAAAKTVRLSFPIGRPLDDLCNYVGTHKEICK